MSNIPPPFKNSVVNGDGLLGSSWHSALRTWYNIAGQETGKLVFRSNTLTTVQLSGNINIGDLRGDVYVNDFKFPTSVTDTYVLVVDSDKTMRFTDPLTEFNNFETADCILYDSSSPPSGWIIANDGTIGSSASSATNRANDDTIDLYTYFWNNYSNTICPVSSGRGSSASNDFDDNKTLALPSQAGRFIGVAGSGSGLTSQSAGVAVGEENHTMTSSEAPVHTHLYYLANGVGAINLHSTSYHSARSTAMTSSSTGGGGSHNNMQPYCVKFLLIKL